MVFEGLKERKTEEREWVGEIREMMYYKRACMCG